jgi:hypothetical protein
MTDGKKWRTRVEKKITKIEAKLADLHARKLELNIKLKKWKDRLI